MAAGKPRWFGVACWPDRRTKCLTTVRRAGRTTWNATRPARLLGRFLGDRREVRGRCAVPEFLWFREHFTRQANYIDTNNINSALRYIWLSKFLFWHRPAH